MNSVLNEHLSKRNFIHKSTELLVNISKTHLDCKMYELFLHKKVNNLTFCLVNERKKSFENEQTSSFEPPPHTYKDGLGFHVTIYCHRDRVSEKLRSNSFKQIHSSAFPIFLSLHGWQSATPVSPGKYPNALAEREKRKGGGGNEHV
jgi:hypothetical protein